MTGEGVFVSAPAKINLFLHVGGRRADGYHDLESLVAFASCGDEIRIVPDEKISLSVCGPFGAELPSGDDNLVLQAAGLLARATNTRVGARIALTKNLPVASGLGGGSADAAAVLRGLAGLWNLDVDKASLRNLGAQLGADVPVCMDSAPAWMEGKGERVRLLPPLPQTYVLLANPRVPVATAAVFAALRKRSGLGAGVPKRFEDAAALVCYLRDTRNDLETPARALAPVIGEVLDALEHLPGALLARMSGSGATCFAVFADESAASTAMAVLKSARPNWWLAACNFGIKS